MRPASSVGRRRDDAADSAPAHQTSDLPSIGRIGPRVDDSEAPYWDGLGSGELRVQRCAERHTLWSFPVRREAADRGMQVSSGLRYSRHTPFEHTYRYHHRDRITEETEEIQMRGVGVYLVDFIKQQTPTGVTVGDWNAYPCWI